LVDATWIEPRHESHRPPDLFADLPEILQLAGEENVTLTTSDGREFVVAEIDDFAEEVHLTQHNEALRRLLDSRAQETPFGISQPVLMHRHASLPVLAPASRAVGSGNPLSRR
jgi:hypothetical protein